MCDLSILYDLLNSVSDLWYQAGSDFPGLGGSICWDVRFSTARLGSSWVTDLLVFPDNKLVPAVATS